MFVLKIAADYYLGQCVAHLEEHSVAELDLVPEAGGGGAGVEELVAVVLLGHVGEVEVALGVYCHPGRVGRLQGSVCSLKCENRYIYITG